jgi:hypothetical protein
VRRCPRSATTSAAGLAQYEREPRGFKVQGDERVSGLRARIRAWLGIHDGRRGTLTFLPGGRTVLGMPGGSAVQADAVAVALEEWLAGDRRPLVLPWPVDVDDQRYPRP